MIKYIIITILLLIWVNQIVYRTRSETFPIDSYTTEVKTDERRGTQLDEEFFLIDWQWVPSWGMVSHITTHKGAPLSVSTRWQHKTILRGITGSATSTLPSSARRCTAYHVTVRVELVRWYKTVACKYLLSIWGICVVVLLQAPLRLPKTRLQHKTKTSPKALHYKR